ncbi:MAG: hypothetical protein ABIH11_04230 [Candidatus Altiarchaeota archaeon]
MAGSFEAFMEIVKAAKEESIREAERLNANVETRLPEVVYVGQPSVASATADKSKFDPGIDLEGEADKLREFVNASHEQGRFFGAVKRMRNMGETDDLIVSGVQRDHREDGRGFYCSVQSRRGESEPYVAEDDIRLFLGLPPMGDEDGSGLIRGASSNRLEVELNMPVFRMQVVPRQARIKRK